jgi:hypothetical protein
MKNNMKNLIILFILFTSISSQCQEKKYPKDLTGTLYFKDGQIREKIYYREYFSTNGGKLRILYDSVCDIIKQKQREIIHYTSDNNWDLKREYFKDSLVRIHHYNLKNQNTGSSSVEVLFNLKEKAPLSLSFLIDKDSLVYSFYITEPNEFDYNSKRTFFSQDFDKPISLTNDFNLKIDNERDLFVKFIDKSFIKYLIYSWKKKLDNEIIDINTFISFYKFNQPKEYGYYYPPFGRKGMWYTYYEDGNLCTEGEYSGSEYDKFGMNEINIKKTGNWIYYSKDGCIEKEEYWENGVLISSTQSATEKKSKKNKR